MHRYSSKQIETIQLQDELINSFAAQNDFGSAAKILLNRQLGNWEQLAERYNSLKTVQAKYFEFDGFGINVQFNPNRIISSSAVVDEEALSKRDCFLCINNLPKAQKSILFDDDYLILANPYPIFPEHFTIANINHFPQRIADGFYAQLSLSKSMSKYFSVFYNGPKCGASAPDHFHFQAGSKNFMPIDNDYPVLIKKYGEILYEESGLKVSAVNDGLRKFVALEGDAEEILIYAFGLFLEAYGSLTKFEDEPMLNILASFSEKNNWRVIIFLREKHRPWCYYAPGDNKILISPAAVDLGGVCITPREVDFSKITKENLVEIFNEVNIGDDLFIAVKFALRENLKKM
ncbi:MAG: DUF4922 domain-containing protein [Ignavibacteriaceae bacterium]